MRRAVRMGSSDAHRATLSELEADDRAGPADGADRPLADDPDSCVQVAVTMVHDDDVTVTPESFHLDPIESIELAVGAGAVRLRHREHESDLHRAMVALGPVRGAALPAPSPGGQRGSAASAFATASAASSGEASSSSMCASAAPISIAL